MISERNNIAAGYTAQGNADAQRIRNNTDRQTSITVADAEARAAVLKAEGEAEYMKILSDAYNDPDKADFYNFVRGLDALEALGKSESTIILDKNSEYARILYGMDKVEKTDNKD
jgi:membrane protease subunit HflC